METPNEDLVTRITLRNNWRHNVNPDRPPKESRELDSFLFFNGAAKCFLKSAGKWLKLTKDGQLLVVSRTLYQFTLREWLEIAKDDNFIPNIL